MVTAPVLTLLTESGGKNGPTADSGKNQRGTGERPILCGAQENG
jgi:hypothetical protein